MPDKETKYQRIMRAVRANSDKNFVQRILYPDRWPKMFNGDGTWSTHRMVSSEADGKYYAHPTLFYDSEKKGLVKPDDPLRYALKTGDYIQFDKDEDAKEFAEDDGYKVAVGMGSAGLRSELEKKLK